MKRYKLAALSLVVTSSLSACAANNTSNNPGGNTGTINEAGNPSTGSSTLKPATTQSTIKNVTVEEASKLISENKDVVILDVRTEEEFKGGHLKNAILIPNEQLNNRISELEKYKEKPILVYCRSGNRSSVAVQTLEKRGFKNIYHMNQGITAWKYDLVK